MRKETFIYASHLIHKNTFAVLRKIKSQKIA